MTMNWTKNRLTGIAGIVIAIVYMIMAMNIKQPPGMTQDILGSRSFPVLAGVVMLISSIIIFLNKKSSEDEEQFGKSELSVLFPYILMVVIYIILLPILGTMISTILFMYFTMDRMSKGVWWRNIVLSVSITLVFWLLFVVVLKVQLPTGLLGVI